MPRDRQGQAAEPTKSAMHELAGHRSARVPGWLVACLRLGVGHASTVRPDPSTLGAGGERGSDRESCSQLVPGSAGQALDLLQVWCWDALGKVQRKDMHFLTAAQVEALADAIEPPYGVLVRVAAYTGLRPCEYFALRVGRLDLLRGTARVAEAAPEVAGHLEWGGVKTTRRGPSGCPVRWPRS